MYALAFLCVLPLIYLLCPKIFTSYFDAFDKLSIPLWAALYSFYWLKFNRKIKKLRQHIPVLKNRVAALERIGNQEYFNEYKSDTAQVSKLQTDLIILEQHFDFINKALRVSVIVAAAIKVIQFLITLLHSWQR